jgi:putative drug exporter of the RND superfamily
MFRLIADLVSKRPAWVLIFWVVLVVVSAPFASLAPKRLVGSASAIANSEAQRVNKLFETKFNQKQIDRTIVVSESALGSEDPKFKSQYDTLTKNLGTLTGVSSVTRYYDDSPLKLRSKDAEFNGKTITATILETRLDKPEPVLESIREKVAANPIPDTKFYVTGATAVTQDFLTLSESDTKRSEFSALPLIALILVLAFGALVAAGIPLIVGMVSITVAMAAVFVVTQFFDVSSFAQSVITMLGLGAGIDYALLLVNRFREELANGRDPRQAAANTSRTAGRAVAFSGLTVAIAMAALLVPNLLFVRSMGIAGVIVVMLTVFSSITAVPAMLALLGDRVNSPRKLQFKFTSSSQSSTFWHNWAERVMKRPWLSSLLIIGFLLFLASPALQMQLGYTGAFGLSSQVESRKGLALIQPLELGGAMDSFEIMLDLGKPGGFDAEARRNWRNLDKALVAMTDVRVVISPFLVGRSNTGGSGNGFGALDTLTKRSISSDRQYLHMSVIPKNAVHPAEIPGWIKRLRATIKDAGFSSHLLGGSPIGAQEFTNAIVNAMPIAIGTVFVATFILMAFAFRSLLIPLKSIIMNTLTVGASYGVITLIFQKGWLASFFNVPTDIGAIDSSLPLVMFAVTFGLSMDYEIFLLSRVQEAHLSGMNTTNSVKSALERTAGVITSAALIMLVVFAAFVQGDVVANKTIGLGLAVAVALDASLVRLILVPAVLQLAGEWNWWLPSGLKRLMPKISLEH